MSQTPTVRRLGYAVTRSLLALAFGLPASGYAQQTMNAQVLTAQGIALTAPDIGPEWAETRHAARRFPGFDRYDVYFGSPSGRAVLISTAVAESPELAEQVISILRYELDDMGLTISSVQNQGFGDGRAFRAQCACRDATIDMYLFRVRELVAWVQYRGAPGASDVATQTQAIARKQERKLFAALAPPPAAPTPTPAPSPVPTVVPASPTPAPVASPSPAPATPVPASNPHCQPGENLQFRFGFAALKAQLGARMGDPTSCEYSDPSGSGDSLQSTTTGLSFYRARTNTPTFTTGAEHWALTQAGTVYWTGDSIDPPATAELVDL